MSRAALTRSLAGAALALAPKRNPLMNPTAVPRIGRTFAPSAVFTREMASKKWSKKGSGCSDLLSYMGDLEPGQNQLIKKLMTFQMRDGKSTKIRPVVYETFHRLARNERDPVQLVTDAIENTKPICEVVKVGVSGTIYDVPGIVSSERQQTLAVRWIYKAAAARRSSKKVKLEKCLFNEILDAYKKKGTARKRREAVHGLAAANRSFAHFRWW